MAARLNVLITSTDLSIAGFNDAVMDRAGSKEAAQALINLLKKFVAGASSDVFTVEITSRDSDVSVGTSGSGSDQESFTY